MAQSAANIHISPARIFLGTTPPASGTPPTLLGHTDGVPSDGTEVGHTEGDAVFTYQLVKEKLMSEQHYMAVDVFPTEETVKLEFNVQERVYEVLQATFDNIGTATDGSKDLFYSGGGSNILAPTSQAIVLTSRIRNNLTKFEVLVIYKAFNFEGTVLTYSKAAPSIMKVTMEGISDTTRNAGDTAFQWFREK